MVELGVNIDHVATLRQARRGHEPDPIWAAVQAELAGLTASPFICAKIDATSAIAMSPCCGRQCNASSTLN